MYQLAAKATTEISGMCVEGQFRDLWFDSERITNHWLRTELNTILMFKTSGRVTLFHRDKFISLFDIKSNRPNSRLLTEIFNSICFQTVVFHKLHQNHLGNVLHYRFSGFLLFHNADLVGLG